MNQANRFKVKVVVVTGAGVGIGYALCEAFAREGGAIVGICNGFQVLTEAGLLPGALQKNRGLKFLCTTVDLRVESTDSPLTAHASAGQVLRIPINHFEGNYTCDAATLASLRADDRIILRVSDRHHHNIAHLSRPKHSILGLGRFGNELLHGLEQ